MSSSQTSTAAVQQALTAGAQLEAAVTVHAWGRLALMADPFGHGFCFVQFSAQGYDAIADQRTTSAGQRGAGTA
ncbi:VOC family protein [Massilia eurypsychrophila]|jgi:uncharacterized glyoxalase superfamily protein PhnB|uniref:VOC family protein n=1 Tax=Massilia eurypsychrophila TaxID=1485217 RepID=UPI0027D8CFB4|nr:VOC family protein [Massilia eurypsychrophila]